MLASKMRKPDEMDGANNGLGYEGNDDDDTDDDDGCGEGWKAACNMKNGIDDNMYVDDYSKMNECVNYPDSLTYDCNTYTFLKDSGNDVRLGAAETSADQLLYPESNNGGEWGCCNKWGCWFCYWRKWQWLDSNSLSRWHQ